MALPARFVGRFKGTDSRVTGKTGDYEPPAQKTEVARFHGAEHMSDRDAETGDLIIFRIDNSAGVPGVEVYGGSTTGDRSPKDLAALQKIYDEAYSSRRLTFEQRSERHGASQTLADLVRR
jgi:hypothetical protein